MKAIKKLMMSYKARQLQKQKEEINHSYNITEKNGIIYITTGYKAIKVVNPEDKVSDILKALEDSRKAQLAYIETK